MEDKTPLSGELSPDSEYIGNGTKDQRNSIRENSEQELIEEKPYKMEIAWPVVTVYALMHLGTLYSSYLFFFRYIKWYAGIFLAYLTGLSITVGAHRLYSHRAFKANKYIRFIIVFANIMAAQKCLYTWARDHRTHHKYSDTNADPHNVRRGFFFSHIGWLMVRKHPDVIRKGKTIDMSDLKQDRIVMFQKKYYPILFTLIGVLLPTAIPCLLWNETLWNSFFTNVVARITVVWNTTFLINSVAHMYGSKPYAQDITPGENRLVSIITLGEGMHNYHHTFPWDYRASEYINFSTRVIDYCMEKGWICDAKTVSSELVKRQTMKNGDGSHPVYNTMNPNGVPVTENY